MTTITLGSVTEVSDAQIASAVADAPGRSCTYYEHPPGYSPVTHVAFHRYPRVCGCIVHRSGADFPKVHFLCERCYRTLNRVTRVWCGCGWRGPWQDNLLLAVAL